jgi:hypothetical protein
MQVMRWVLAAMLILGSASVGLAAAEFSGDASVGVYNKYIWRGLDLGSDANFLVQPAANLGFGGATIGVWGNYNEASKKVDEIDLTLEYSHDINEQLSARVGHILYSVVDGADTAEVYAGVTLALPVTIDVDAYYDYDEAKAWFLTGGVSKTVKLADSLGLNLGATAGYFDFDYLNNGELSASLDYALSEAFIVTPSLLYSAPLSQDAKDAGVHDAVVTALTVLYTF